MYGAIVTWCVQKILVQPLNTPSSDSLPCDISMCVLVLNDIFRYINMIAWSLLWLLTNHGLWAIFCNSATDQLFANSQRIKDIWTFDIMNVSCIATAKLQPYRMRLTVLGHVCLSRHATLFDHWIVYLKWASTKYCLQSGMSKSYSSGCKMVWVRSSFCCGIWPALIR